MNKKELKKYNKPILTIHGDLKKYTQAGQNGSGDYAGKHGNH